MNLSADIARCFDPVIMATDCGLTPDPWQARLMRERPRRGLILASRQVGKTTTCGQIGLHTALYSSSALVLIVSPSQRQSGEIFRSVMTFYRKLKGAPELAAESALRAEFKNGSRLIALPGNEATIRGYSGANLIILDEASRVEDELLGGITPMLATTNGSLLALTTPAGKRGWFHDQWFGADDWTRVRINAADCPRISAAFLEEEKRRLGPSVFSQEYDLEFVDNANSMWSVDDIIFEDFPTLFGR